MHIVTWEAVKIQRLNSKGENKDKAIIIIIINENDNDKNEAFHFDNYVLTMALLPKTLVRRIFWFPKYTLYLHEELS